MQWTIDPVHTSVGFAVKHMMVSTVRGRFGAVRGSIDLDPAAPERSGAEIAIDAASVDTGMPTRDDHLRSADFFDAARFPEIEFRATRVHPLGGTRFRVDGDLTIRGTTHPIALEAELSGTWGDRVGISARGAIDRKDFGLLWNRAIEAGGVMVGDTVTLELEFEAVRRPETVAA
jgi:polyisoprenoid-binding protein YceI